MRMLASVLILLSTQTALAVPHTSSSDIGRRGNVLARTARSFVDLDHCTAPIRSTPYVIILGTGGANMKLTCPHEAPVMYGWKQQVGFVGWPAVTGGGGSSWITCCPIGHQWEVVRKETQIPVVKAS